MTLTYPLCILYADAYLLVCYVPFPLIKEINFLDLHVVHLLANIVEYKLRFRPKPIQSGSVSV